MPGQVLTEVGATVEPERELGLGAAFQDVSAEPVPDALVGTEYPGAPLADPADRQAGQGK